MTSQPQHVILKAEPLTTLYTMYPEQDPRPHPNARRKDMTRIPTEGLIAFDTETGPLLVRKIKSWIVRLDVPIGIILTVCVIRMTQLAQAAHMHWFGIIGPGIFLFITLCVLFDLKERKKNHIALKTQ